VPHLQLDAVPPLVPHLLLVFSHEASSSSAESCQLQLVPWLPLVARLQLFDELLLVPRLLLACRLLASRPKLFTAIYMASTVSLQVIYKSSMCCTL
jgi:hypothetical protein